MLLSTLTPSSGFHFAFGIPSTKRRRNPVTLSPKKKALKKSRATWATADTPDVHLSGGALQTTFQVEGVWPLQ